MGLILLEALGALVLLVGIVWWTMFSGRKRGELQVPPLAAQEKPTPPSAPVSPLSSTELAPATPRTEQQPAAETSERSDLP